jgi:peptidoglycan/LPS O-acetylase OafA/YrhL
MASRHETAIKTTYATPELTAAEAGGGGARVAAATRISELDGWRAMSILCVIAGHWLPLGPHAWGLNTATAATGMALFFSLSGFLIARVLMTREQVPVFLIRRLFRIMPLAWAATLILVVVNGVSPITALANFAFFANLPPDHLMPGGHHLWSLCVEVQFYLAVAVIVAVAGPRGLWLAPLGAIAVTIARIDAAQPMSIVTWHRVDEILAGATLALLIYWTDTPRWIARLPRWTPLILAALLLLSGMETLAPLAYARPYLAAMTIGVSIFAAPGWLRALLCSTPARYIASISFAVYVIHGMLGDTWLGTGDTLEKYAKRPILAAVTWLLAHLSTFRFENPMIDLGKRVSHRFQRSEGSTRP